MTLSTDFRDDVVRGSDPRPERLGGPAYSTLDRLSEGEYQAGLERAERELPEVVEYVLEWTIVVGEA